MNHEELKSEIYKLTNNNEIFISQDQKELKIWTYTNSSELYTIYMCVWLDDKNSVVIIRNYALSYLIRGTGLGSKLFDIFEKYFSSNNYKEIQLHQVLTRAEKFWTKKGFSIQNHIWRKLLNI